MIMKFLHIIFLMTCLRICMPSDVMAQDISLTDPQSIDIDLVIPPLSVVLDSAIAHNAMVKFRDFGIIGKECNLNSYRNYWTRNFGVQADVRYGTFNNFSTNTAEGQSPSLFATNVIQTNYGIGLYVKFPLQDALNRRTQIRMADSELEQAKSMAQAQREELIQAVISQYNDVLLKQRILDIRAKNLSTSKTNMEMLEKEFQNGVVDLTEYTRISDIVARTEADFETARTDLITTYMILEVIAGFKFSTYIP